tara:strand:+ start:77 stop:220 length:144 start_codon:yes stop_codon:yes gene_type:complete
MIRNIYLQKSIPEIISLLKKKKKLALKTYIVKVLRNIKNTKKILGHG